jgi:hypothetical protein
MGGFMDVIAARRWVSACDDQVNCTKLHAWNPCDGIENQAILGTSMNKTKILYGDVLCSMSATSNEKRAEISEATTFKMALIINKPTKSNWTATCISATSFCSTLVCSSDTIRSRRASCSSTASRLQQANDWTWQQLITAVLLGAGHQGSSMQACMYTPNVRFVLPGHCLQCSHVAGLLCCFSLRGYQALDQRRLPQQPSQEASAAVPAAWCICTNFAATDSLAQANQSQPNPVFHLSFLQLRSQGVHQCVLAHALALNAVIERRTHLRCSIAPRLATASLLIITIRTGWFVHALSMLLLSWQVGRCKHANTLRTNSEATLWLRQIRRPARTAQCWIYAKALVASAISLKDHL